MARYNQSIYSVSKRGRFYYFPRKRKPIPKTYFAYKHLKTLSNKSRNFLLKKLKFIKKGYQPGVYAIFIRDPKKYKNKLGLGRCLYVGQSTNIKSRKLQHIECIKTAKRQIKNLEPKTLENKYYMLAQDELKGHNLVFVSVWEADKKEWRKLSKDEYRELLCLYEQWAMDVFNPKYNVLPSRKSQDWRSKNNEK